MPPLSRSDLLTKIHQVLKKHYNLTVPSMNLPLMEQLIFACCLEESPAEAAQTAYTTLEEQFFDWNEVRVSTVVELGDKLSMLPDPRAAAARVQQTLHSVFETDYTFDLDALKKQNIGVAVKQLQKHQGVTSFGVSYVTQTSLGGHDIPVSPGGLEVLFILGVIDEKERTAKKVPGLERAIAKTKGQEFGALLNQLAYEFTKSPHSPAVRKLMLSISPDAKERFPKRRNKAAEAKKAKAEAEKKAAAEKAAVEKVKAEKKAAAAKKKAAAAKKRAKAAPAKKKAVKKQPAKKTVKKKTVKKKTVTKKPTKKTAKKKATTKKAGAKKTAKKKIVKKKATTKRPAKRKPR